MVTNAPTVVDQLLKCHVNDMQGGSINNCLTIFNTAATMIMMTVPFRASCRRRWLARESMEGWHDVCLANCVVRQPCLPTRRDGSSPNMVVLYEQTPRVGWFVPLPTLRTWSYIPMSTRNPRRTHQKSSESPRYLCLPGTSTEP
jgi:hypothetical protein